MFLSYQHSKDINYLRNTSDMRHVLLKEKLLIWVNNTLVNVKSAQPSIPPGQVKLSVDLPSWS